MTISSPKAFVSGQLYEGLLFRARNPRRPKASRCIPNGSILLTEQYFCATIKS